MCILPYNGRKAFWAHGEGTEGNPFPVVIVPYDNIVAQAVEAEIYVREKVFQSLLIATSVLFGAIGLVVIVALVSSRSVTRPLLQIADVADKLSQGDYEARAEVKTGDELQYLSEMFNEIGPKLRDRERIKRSLAIAREIQQHLLPQENPQIPGFDIAGFSVYCDETGGDYYDFIDLMDIDSQKLGIAVGDVTGHGISAALLMASARGVLRSNAGQCGIDLTNLFQILNRHLVRDTDHDRFMTLFYGVLDAKTRELWWISGGHDPALWLRRTSGQIEELPNTGVPLGIIEDTDYGQAGPVTLEKGDIIVVGTDGIWEAHNLSGEMFDKKRLCDLLAGSSKLSAEQIHQTVIEAVNLFRNGAPQEDDITLVVIKAL